MEIERQRLRPFTVIAFCAWFISAPFLIPNIATMDRWANGLSGGQTPVALINGTQLTFLFTLSLAIMFTALAVLFVSLLKTGFGNVSLKVGIGASLCYLLGWVVLAGSIFVGTLDRDITLPLAGLLLGFGSAMLSMMWVRQLYIGRFRSALRWLVMLGLVVSGCDAVLLAIPENFAFGLVLVLAVLGTVGCLVGYGRIVSGGVTVEGSNWWNIFGRLDTSLLDNPRAFKGKPSRALFFLIIPVLMLLLLVADMDVYHTTYIGTQTFEILSCVIGSLLVAPLAFVREDARTMTFAYRVYLPVIGIAVLIVENFITGDTTPFLDVGVFAFFSAYLLVMVAVALTMIGRMESLEMPGTGFLLVGFGLITMLAFTPIDAGALEAYHLQAMLVIFIACIILLLVTPSFDIWDLALGDVPEGTPGLEERCNRVAKAYSLTSREAEILRYLGRGHGSAYIASTLVVAESTIRTHVKSIYHKTGVTSREELIELIDSTTDEPTPKGTHTRIG